MVSAVAKWAVGINAYVLQCAAVHGASLMNLVVGDNGTAEVAVQKENNRTVKFRMVPGVREKRRIWNRVPDSTDMEDIGKNLPVSYLRYS